jgi:putative molybdopterin biosynthesis protein
VALADALGRVLARDVASPVDVPPFDRSMVDGFAVTATDTVGAGDSAPRRLTLNAEVVACGHAPGDAATVTPGTAAVVATGAVIPRGADAVVMVEWTDPDGPDGIEVRRAAAPGQAIAFAGSDIARGETVLRRGTRLTSREIGMLAACGVAAVDVVRQPVVGVISTGDELAAPGEPLPPAGIYDSNSAIVAATVAENGGVPRHYGVIRDDEDALRAAVAGALRDCDAVILSGGTSKGAGDVSHRVIQGLGEPGIVVHGVALKPGKPLVLAVAQGKPMAVLPGFPTSAIFTFRTFLVPVLRAMAGLPPEDDATVSAHLPVRLPSDVGRTEFAMVALSERDGGFTALPTGKGSGSVTSFSQADGFVEIEALSDGVGPDATVTVHLLDRGVSPPALTLTGSHCVGLDAVLGHVIAGGITARTLAVGSMGGAAAVKRGECDLAPVHLMDPATGVYNEHLLAPGLRLVPGWRRKQGIVHRPGDTRFEGRIPEAAMAAALADPACVMVNRNTGAGTRVLIDRLLGGARPRGWTNQPRSHNAVAAAVAQGRADWGVAIATVARDYGLGFMPLQDEHYDFLLAEARADHAAVRAFLAVLAGEAARNDLRALGFDPA